MKNKIANMPTPLFVSGAAVYPYSEKLKERFTCVSRYGDQFELFKVTGVHTSKPNILLPRALCPEGEVDKRIKGQAIKFDINFKPRSAEQARVVAECAERLLAGESFITQCPTGFGKTYVGSYTIGVVGRKALVICAKSDTLKQWREALGSVLNLKTSEIGLIQSDTCNVVGKKVVLTMAHSICKNGRYPEWIYREFGYVLTDEVQVMGAETFSEAMWLFPALLRMGLSATPYRKDGKDRIFYGHIGPVKVISEAMPMVPKVIKVKSTYKLPRVKRRNKATGMVEVVKMPHSPGRIASVVKLMAKDPARNALIVDFVKAAYDKGRLGIIQSDSKDHLDRLYHLFRAAGIPSKDIGYYIGGMKEQELEASKVKPVILATYGMTAMATDIPWLNYGVQATPRSDVVQIAGRVCREWPDKPTPILFDILDEDSPVLAGYSKTRDSWYASVGAGVTRKY